MGDYTDQDRERSQKTLTLVEQSIKQNDERHDDIKDMLKKHENKFEKQGEKIQANKTMITKVAAINTLIAVPIIAALAAFGKKIIG